MDSITELVKSEIKRQYGSVQSFSKASGIPYSTLSNALARGIGSMAYDTVTKVCSLLKIRQVYDEDLVLFNKEFYEVYEKLTKLDEMGVHTVCSVLNVEYQRCRNENDPKARGFNGIGFIAQKIDEDEERIRKLIQKARANKKDE